MTSEESQDLIAEGQPYIIRLRMPDQEPCYTDLVYGTVGHRKPESPKRLSDQWCLRDPVMMKSDGFPTYHLANVVDDHHMKITHVIRAAVSAIDGHGSPPKVPVAEDDRSG